MRDLIGQEILKVSLKFFAEKGYNGVTTKNIAEEVGCSEMTIYRKFKTKKNLLNKVIKNNIPGFDDDHSALISENNFKDPLDFLNKFIKKYAKFTCDHFEFIKITAFDPAVDDSLVNELMAKYNFKIAKYIERNIQNDKIDAFVLTLTLNTFLYFFCYDEYRGRIIVDRENVLEKFINNIALSI